MEIMGIKFAPLNVPWKRRLQTLAVGTGFTLLTFGSFAGCGIIFFLVLFTSLWPISLLYLLWIFVIDKEISEKGGRPLQFVRDSTWWKYFRDYFPITVNKDSDATFDPQRNYLFCSFPHGFLATGAFTAFSTSAGGFHKLFPNHQAYTLTLKQNFNMPFFREFLLSVGMCAASAESINWLMRAPEGGKIAVLAVGGAAESFYSRPGQYQLVLKNRKGFVRLALKNGSPLVPVFSFGETDIFDQVDNPEGSWLRSLQEWAKRKTGIAPIIPVGRGYFQYSFGMLPRRKPINIIIGKPIDVEKMENPNQEQIDTLHETFMKELTKLFEENKHKYLNNPNDTSLVIV